MNLFTIIQTISKLEMETVDTKTTSGFEGAENDIILVGVDPANDDVYTVDGNNIQIINAHGEMIFYANLEEEVV